MRDLENKILRRFAAMVSGMQAVGILIAIESEDAFGAAFRTAACIIFFIASMAIQEKTNDE